MEVKSSRRVGEPSLRGLRAVGGLAGLRRRILVYLGKRDLVTADGIEVLGIERFLEELAADTLW